MVVPRTSITLRRFREEDTVALSRWACNEHIPRTFDSSGELAGADVDAAHRHITEELSHQPHFMVICVGGRSFPAGAVSLTMLSGDRDRHRAELDYFVAPELRGRGVGTAAVEITARFAFQRWSHLLRLDALVDAANGASRRVLEKNGFTKEGLLRMYAHTRGRPRDVYMYALLRSDLSRYDRAVNLFFPIPISGSANDRGRGRPASRVVEQSEEGNASNSLVADMFPRRPIHLNHQSAERQNDGNEKARTITH